MRSQIARNQPKAINIMVNHMYAFTLRKLKNPNRLYAPIREKVRWLEKRFNGDVTLYYIEHCKTGQPHAHGILETKSPIQRTDRIKVRGWSNDLRPITDLAGWKKYIKKQQPKDEGYHSDYDPTDEDIQQLADYQESVKLTHNLFYKPPIGEESA